MRQYNIYCKDYPAGARYRLAPPDFPITNELLLENLTFRKRNLYQGEQIGGPVFTTVSPDVDFTILYCR